MDVASASARPTTRPVPLTSLRPGQTAVISGSRLDADESALLSAMGLAERTRIKVCRLGEPCVVALGQGEGRHCHCNGHCRIGLARTMAERLFVTVVA